jgi:hypothetical protein
MRLQTEAWREQQLSTATAKLITYLELAPMLPFAIGLGYLQVQF